jgi:hypothetical protein
VKKEKVNEKQNGIKKENTNRNNRKLKTREEPKGMKE